MKPQFELGRNTAVINFSAHYCNSEEELLNSQGFTHVLARFLKIQKKKESVTYEKLATICTEEKILTELLSLFKLLLVLEIEDIRKMDCLLNELLNDEKLVIEFIEEFYDFWRRLERYSIIYNHHAEGTGIQQIKFIEANSAFGNLVLSVYRTLTEKLLNHHQNVYRQLIVGVNAGIVLREVEWDAPEEYKGLLKPEFIDSIVLTPPFITYPQRNKRDGIFKEVWENPLEGLNLNPDEWLVYPAKVGKSLVYVFFHRDFMSQGISMCNLFELADLEECKNQKPDLIYVYGNKDEEDRAVFYQDKKNDIMIGYASYSEDFDYFGYMKKMILTLHNVRMINEGKLPLHGAMVELTLKDGSQSNIIIIGDSGAGKSETLEALRLSSEDEIKEMNTIFDDMGTLLFEDGEIRAYGTEIGAFVRLDDLDTGYAYRTIDRSIFMNPDKINARLVIPVATYQEITTPKRVDLFLYANNYDETATLIDLFDNEEIAKDVFVRGARKAKGTTTETGLVESYFANPFGPVQLKEQTDKLIDLYFKALFDQGIEVGQIYTQLAVKGKEHIGPQEAAKDLLEKIKE